MLPIALFFLPNILSTYILKLPLHSLLLFPGPIFLFGVFSLYCSPPYFSPSFKATLPYTGCKRRHVLHLTCPNLDATYEKSQVRRGRTEASLTQFSVILLLGWPSIWCTSLKQLPEAEREHRGANGCPSFSNLGPTAQSYYNWDQKHSWILWSWLHAVTKSDQKLILEVCCRNPISCKNPNPLDLSNRSALVRLTRCKYDLNTKFLKHSHEPHQCTLLMQTSNGLEEKANEMKHWSEDYLYLWAKFSSQIWTTDLHIWK